MAEATTLAFLEVAVRSAATACRLYFAPTNLKLELLALPGRLTTRGPWLVALNSQLLAKGFHRTILEHRRKDTTIVWKSTQIAESKN